MLCAECRLTPPIKPIKPHPKSFCLLDKLLTGVNLQVVTRWLPSPWFENHQCIIILAVMWDKLFFPNQSALTSSHIIQEDWEIICSPHTRMLGIPITCLPQNLAGVFVSFVATPAVLGQHLPLYFPNRFSLLS